MNRIEQPFIKNVVIAVLSNGDWCGDTSANLAGLCLHSAYNCRKDFIISAIIHEKSSIVKTARNHVVEQAKAMLGVTHLLFIDADMTFPVNALDRLMKQDKDVIGCNALRRNPPFTPTGQELLDGKWNLGACFMLIKMEVFDKIQFPWFDDQYLPGKLYQGEDQNFCMKVNELSSVHCDEKLSQEIGHVGQMSFTLAMHNQIQNA